MLIMQKLIGEFVYDTKNAKEIIKYKTCNHKITIYKSNNGTLFYTYLDDLNILTLEAIQSCARGIYPFRPDYGQHHYNIDEYRKELLPQYQNDFIYMWLFFNKEYDQLKKRYPQYNYKNCQIIYKYKIGSSTRMLCRNKINELFIYIKPGFFEKKEDEFIHMGFRIDDSEKFNRYVFEFIKNHSLKEAEKRFPQYKYKRA